MVGEVIGSGGKALESDLISKRIEFFKTLGEHIQNVGERIIASGSLNGSLSADIYTVPSNKLLFLYYLSYYSLNTGAANTRQFFFRIGTANLIDHFTAPGGFINDFIVFPIPLLIRQAEVLRVAKNTVNVDHRVGVIVMGFEIPIELSNF